MAVSKCVRTTIFSVLTYNGRSYCTVTVRNYETCDLNIPRNRKCWKKFYKSSFLVGNMTTNWLIFKISYKPSFLFPSPPKSGYTNSNYKIRKTHGLHPLYLYFIVEQLKYRELN